MNRTCWLFACLLLLPGSLASTALGADPAPSPKSNEKAAGSTTVEIPDIEPEITYLLRYQFKAGETLRWEVEHRAQVRTTVSGTTQTAETTTTSVKSWKVTDVNADGEIKFVHSVESVHMLQRLTGRQDVQYDSKTDKEPPVGFQDVAKAVGVPLSIVTIDASGKVLEREDKQPRPGGQSTHITTPLPEEAVPLGHRWTVPYDVVVTTKEGGSRNIKLRQQMTLVDVKDGIATIAIDNQVLTPVSDPAVEAQLVQSETSGKIRFDMKAGRVISQISDCDKNVVGFQGESSSLHYVTRFTENLLSIRMQVTKAGPAPPPSSKPAPSTAANRPALPPTASSTARPGMQPQRPAIRRR